MRKIAISCTLLMLAGLAMGQMAPAPGYAFDQAYGNQGPRLISTPTMSLETPAPIVGASNATLDNIVGATNSTLSTVSTSVIAKQSTAMSGETSTEESAGGNETPSSFNLGIARFQSSEGVAALMANAGDRRKAPHVYTNQDVERVNQENGKVKAGDKTEHLD